MIVCQIRKRGLSFASSRELRQRIDLLPDTVRWKQAKVIVPGGRTARPLTFYYRSAFDCFKFLFANPLLANHMDFKPQRDYTNEDKSERLYTELMTGDLAWSLQVLRSNSMAQSFI